MPENTPIYGFTYPCLDETVSPAAFATLAQQIEAKLVDVEADRTLALNRPNVSVLFGALQTFTQGVEATFTVPGSTYIIPMSGVWNFTFNAFMEFPLPATLTSCRVRILQNGVVRAQSTRNLEGDDPRANSAHGTLVAQAGDTVTFSYLYTGTATVDVSGQFSGRLMCRAAS